MKPLVIGVGAAGNKAALTVAQMNEEITVDDVILVNSTTKDIPQGFTGQTIILSPDDTGCGKQRSDAKGYVISAIQSGKFDFDDKVNDYDIIIVISSLEGGTGSGASPMIASYCSQHFGKNTHLIGFTGFEEDPRGLQNSVEFFQEIGDDLIVQVIPNNEFLRQAGNNKFKAEQLANKELARRISIIDGSLMEASDQNIDATDIFKVSNTLGYTIVGYEEISTPLTDVTDFNNLCEKLIFNNKSLKSKEPGQQRMAVVMNISPVSENAVDLHFTKLKEAYGTAYEVFVHKQYNPDKPEFIAFISSGQKMPLDEVKAIYERYNRESGNVNKETDSFFEEVKSMRGISQDSKFDMGRTPQKTTSKDDFLKQFQTKPAGKVDKK